MSISRDEAIQLVRKCIPEMRRHCETNLDGITLKVQDVVVKTLCRLWGGMGYILSVSILGGKHQIIVKRIIPPSKKLRSFGDERKAISYQVEANFYENVAPTLISEYELSIPIPYLVERSEMNNDQITICMSRLDGNPRGLSSDDEVHAVLRWLATFHAATWGEKAENLVTKGGLQPIGSYWHLDTRPDEHNSISRRGWEGRLKKAARAIDERLKRDPMQCCIHGDAKDANMLFYKGENNKTCVAMYDFQYCGKAPPSVDLAYFLCVAVGSGSDNRDLLKYYYNELLSKLDSTHDPPSFQALEDSLAIAFCDFQRFLSGWRQWGTDLSDIVTEVLNRLDGGKELTEDEYKHAMLKEFG